MDLGYSEAFRLRFLNIVTLENALMRASGTGWLGWVDRYGEANESDEKLRIDNFECQF